MITEKLERFRRLSREERWRAARASAAVGAVECALRMVSFDVILRALRRWAGLGVAVDSDVPAVTRWIEAADRIVPGRSSCLRRSLAAAWLLGGLPGFEMRLSARPDLRGGIDGHAWVRVGKHTVVPAGKHRDVPALLVLRSG